MRTSKSRLGVALCISLIGACNGDGNEVETRQDNIVRATSNGGRNEVVMVFALVGSPSEPGIQLCTGSYYAPRVVLTAAHCLQNIVGSNPPQLFVYYGDDFNTDFGELTPGPDGLTFIPPPIGAPSHWAQADSFTVNPAYDAFKNAQDDGVIFLDRKPPFDPLPLYRNKVNASVPVTISGWGASDPNDLFGTAFVQRTGKTVTLGSPTAADYHADDPNPGMLDPAVRATVIKTEGHAPKSNGCFGDSGGPIILNQSGQDYVAGVNYWGGVNCEDYALYVRIDSFLPFLDLSYKRGGQDVLKPTFACVTPNPSGSLTAVFGYRNDNGVGISIPYGTKNQLARDTAGYRPTRFRPGTHAYSFGVDFTSGQTVSWTLSPDNNPTTTLTASSSSPRCSTTAPETVAVLTCRALKRSGCTAVGTYEACIESTAESARAIAQFAPSCVDEFNALQSCIAATPPGAANWACFDGGAESQLCTSQSNAFGACLSGG